VDAQGNIIEEWTQWDKLFKRPHAVYISPYDSEKHVWVGRRSHTCDLQVHERRQAARQTIGTPNVPGADCHALQSGRPFMAWLPDGSFYVADGYNGTRVAKFDARASSCSDFGKRGDAGKETRPGYMNNVHGVAVDLETRRCSSTIATTTASRSSTRTAIPVRVEIAVSPSSLHFVQIGADRAAVTFDRNTHKMLKYDLDGRLLYAWGTVADFPGTLWGVHGMSTTRKATSTSRRWTPAVSRSSGPARRQPGVSDRQARLLGLALTRFSAAC
jgi:hypothetical protein